MSNALIESRRAATVAKWFGVKRELASVPPAVEFPNIELNPGTIVLVTGPSGAGKSTFLRHLQNLQRPRIDINAIELPPVPVVDCFGRARLERILTMLGRVGLGEVWTYLRTPGQLSEGQRWRLRLAIALWQARKLDASHGCPVFIADEFAAMLDRVSAKIVARCLR